VAACYLQRFFYRRVNPIWTIDSGAYCLFSTTPEAFFATSSGLTFVVKNFDPVGRDAIFGIVVLSQEELLEGTGDRKEYPLEFGEVENENGSSVSVLCVTSGAFSCLGLLIGSSLLHCTGKACSSVSASYEF